MQRNSQIPYWKAFTRALEQDFGPSLYDYPRASLFKLVQTGTVNEFYLEFTALTNRSEGLTAEAVLDCFISGLQEDIRRDVRAMEPNTLVRTVALAKLFEEKYTTSNKNRNMNKGGRSNSYGSSANTLNIKNSLAVSKSEHSNNQTKAGLPPLLPTPNMKPNSNGNTRNPNNKNMSAAEIQLRRDKGLCYFCDEKFSYTHKCPNKHKFMMLQLTDDEDNEEVDENKEPQNTTPEQQMNKGDEHQLSLNAMKGGMGKGTIRFSGRIGPIQIQVLLDGGSSENFLQPRIAQCLKLAVEPQPSFGFLIGNGQSMQTEGWIEKLTVQIQGQELAMPVYLLPVVGADLILGASWLATLGPHVADYATAVIKFFHQNQFITLKGDQEMGSAEAQFHQLRRMNSTDTICECFTVQMIQTSPHTDTILELPENMEPELTTLLQTYRQVFDTPTGLPPDRNQNHAISLMEGAKPVKVRPYRYPHSQKE